MNNSQCESTPMQCQEVLDELVAYDRGELDAHDLLRIGDHIAACENCRAELHALRSTMQLLRHSLVAVEPSANIRQRMRERISRPRSMLSRRRFITMGRASAGWQGLLTDRLRRSPYFAASLLAHAALLLVALGVGVYYWGADGDRDETHAIRAVHTASQRARAMHGIRTQAMRVSTRLNQNQLDLTPHSRAASAEAVYLAGDPQNGCIWAFPVGGPTNRSEEDFRRQMRRRNSLGLFSRVPNKDGRFAIPEALSAQYLEGVKEVVVVDLLTTPRKERLEIWSASRWNAYRNDPRYAGSLSFGPLYAACLTTW